MVYRKRFERDKAHRVAWQLKNRKRIPRNKPFILHSCDNPPCCNPSHLSPGTCRDNIRDMMKKGRGATVEERRSNATLTVANVRFIRREVQRGVPQKKLAKKFNVSRPSISEAVNFRTWRSA